jgi:hypothetical protein
MRTVYIGFRLSAPVEWPQGKAPGQGPIVVTETEHPYTPFTGEEAEPVASVAPAKPAEAEKPVETAAPAVEPKPAAVPVAEAKPAAPAPTVEPKLIETKPVPATPAAVPAAPAKAEPSPAAARFATIVSADATLASAAGGVELVQVDGVATLRGRVADGATRNRLGLAAMRAVGDRVVNRVEIASAPAATKPETPVAPAQPAPAAPVEAPKAETPAPAPAEVAKPEAAKPEAPKVEAPAPAEPAKPEAPKVDAPAPAEAAKPEPVAPAAAPAVPEPAWKQTFAKSVAADAALAEAAKDVELVEVAGVPTLRGAVPSAAVRAKVATLALRAVRGHVDVKLEVKPAAPAP